MPKARFHIPEDQTARPETSSLHERQDKRDPAKGSVAKSRQTTERPAIPRPRKKWAPQKSGPEGEKVGQKKLKIAADCGFKFQ